MHASQKVSYELGDIQGQCRTDRQTDAFIKKTRYYKIIFTNEYYMING